MKRLTYTSLLLLSLTLIDGHIAAQDQNGRGERRALSSRGSEDANAVDLTERKKLIAECEIQDRTKPQGEIKRVSQLCGKAISLPMPPYPEEAKSQRVSGIVKVDVVTNEDGQVIWAKAVSGPDLLQGVSMKAACRAQYSPTLISGRAVKTESSISYSFVRP
jgi:outer membrane biosynthesis protein TonB